MVLRLYDWRVDDLRAVSIKHFEAIGTDYGWPIFAVQFFVLLPLFAAVRVYNRWSVFAVECVVW